MTKTKYSISPNRKIICWMYNFGELNKAAWGCKYYFTTSNNRLLYFKHKTYLHELHSKRELAEINRALISNFVGAIHTFDISDYKFVQWSIRGECAYFLQYSVTKGVLNYYSIFIDFETKNIYSIDENNNNFEIINKLKVINANFEWQFVQQQLRNNKVFPSELRLDKASLFFTFMVKVKSRSINKVFLEESPSSPENAE